MRKEVLNICFSLYLVIALRKYANPSSVLLQSIYNLLRSREGVKTREDGVYDMKHILSEKNQNRLPLTDNFRETPASESLLHKVA